MTHYTNITENNIHTDQINTDQIRFHDQHVEGGTGLQHVSQQDLGFKRSKTVKSQMIKCRRNRSDLGRSGSGFSQ